MVPGLCCDTFTNISIIEIGCFFRQVWTKSEERERELQTSVRGETTRGRAQADAILDPVRRAAATDLHLLAEATIEDKVKCSFIVVLLASIGHVISW